MGEVQGEWRRGAGVGLPRQQVEARIVAGRYGRAGGMTMADFGSMFDKAKTDAETAAQSFKDDAKRMDQEADTRFQREIKPITDVLDPVLKDAETQLKTKGIELAIDLVADLRQKNGVRQIGKHFQLQMIGGAQSSFYMFLRQSNTIIVSSYPYDTMNFSRGVGLLGINLGGLTTGMVEDVVGRAVKELGEQAARR